MILTNSPVIVMLHGTMYKTIFRIVSSHGQYVPFSMYHNGGSRNFKTGGGGGPGAVEFWGLGFLLMPLV